ncbi:MAG: methylmalonyl-CoA mutase [Candidatus Dormibacteraeota bacterium]|uniref:Methylmalonyl-CoA mutase n=1 Tax=Candidatus Aeolococcus gillhamiae TaxID=3127015 RepID=A0A934MYP0_9BACT|nr:methylmalonyl-CoA mutase [Candidatus Dormibacteraeota bacterium]
MESVAHPNDSDAQAEIGKAVEQWRGDRLLEGHKRFPPRREEFTTLSGRPIADVYTPRDTTDLDYMRDIGLPGEYPYTRGPHASMYRGRPWTIRQVSGYGQAEDTNARYKYLLEHGETGLSTDFDLPTLLGYDSDHPIYRREVGKVGVAIDSLTDAHALFDGIPLGEISTSLTVNGSAAAILAMYKVVGEQRGFSSTALTGTIQNDILKEYTSQNEFIFPPTPSVKLVVDTMEWCAERMPQFNPVNVCGYHIREAGATAVEEVAFALAAGICYLEAAVARGINADAVAPRISFFWDVHNDFLEEVAKLRAARRLWARLLRERLGCQDPRSWMMRSHCQTAGVSLTAQQPLNNVARTALQALAAVMGGTQSLHTNSLDEAMTIPSEDAIKVAVRTQQIVLHETGVADVVDPLGGSYYVEALTSRIEEEARSLIGRIDEQGGMIAAIINGFVSQLIADSAWEQQMKIQDGERIVVGVNAFADGDSSTGGIDVFRLPPEVLERQLQRLERVKREREQRRVADALRNVEQTAPDLAQNLMPSIEEAVRAMATVGEIYDVLRGVWGQHQPSTVF